MQRGTVRVAMCGIALILLISGCAAAGSTTASGDQVPAVDAVNWVSYSDTDGDSSVAAYQAGTGFLWVRFDDGSAYLYTDSSAGSSDIATMQQLAAQGDGLNEFIQRNARYAYADKVTS